MSKEYLIPNSALPATASRLHILIYLHQNGPVSVRQLFNALQIHEEAQENAFRRIQKMAKEDILSLKSTSWDDPVQTNQKPIEGLFQGTSKGTGFLKIEQNLDGFIDKKQANGAFHGDFVRAWIIGRDEKGRFEIAIEHILKRNPSPWVGTVEFHHQQPCLKNFDKRRPLLPLTASSDSIMEGMVVQAQLIQQSDLSSQLEIQQILGEKLNPTLCSEVTKIELELPTSFSSDVLKEANDSSKDILSTGRLDLRQIPFVTIDGASSRDFDDAVYAKPCEDGGFDLWVAIADVSAYVQPNSLLDLEALNRGTSIYLPDQVIPMLPEVLSNELCSLNPGVDRLCVVCQMHINEKAEITQASFSKAIMHSHARLTYLNATQKMQEISSSSPHEFLVHQNLKALASLQYLFEIRHPEHRKDRQEYRFKLKQDGQLQPYLPEERTLSHRVIETCMILANVSAANHLKSKQNGVFRVHSQPLEAKYDALNETLQAFGVQAPAWQDLNKQNYNQLLKTLQDHQESKRLTPLAQRLPSSAKYEMNNGGHFSLGLEAYTHFTSPIRRYPDLLVHRALFDEPLPVDLDQVLVLCNEREKRASLAERQVMDRWKCAWLEQQEEHNFEGIVTGIKSNGIWVTIAQGIEGFLSLKDIPGESWIFDPIRHELQNENLSLTLGSELIIHLKSVNMGERKIDWGYGTKAPQPNLFKQKI